MVRFALAVGFTAFCLAAPAPVPGAESARDEVLRVEKQRFAAMVEGDVAGLDALLAEDLTYVHSNGRVEGKKEYLEALEGGTVRYLSAVPKDLTVRVYGDVAVGSGLVHFHVKTAERELKLVSRYTDVYVKRDGRWRLAAWQSTPVPEP